MAKFFISTAIAYVNDKPHLGHALEFIQADVLARYHRQRGDKVLFSTGTDEHGGKILEKAQAAGQSPQVFADAISQKFIELCQHLGVAYDSFVRTTSPAHIKSAQAIWQSISHDLYKHVYKGFYCTGCEKFISNQEAKANQAVCPIHNRSYDQLEEENYFFKLSQYTKPIQTAITKGELQILPLTRKNEILALLKDGLDDISFSRPKEKLPWGIEVAGDPAHVMYVWPDALTNYLTVTGFPANGFEQWWPADVHLIGKDILRFHAAIWPAMLLSAGLPLPKAIYAHGFITSEGKKMSKSLGNVVDPLEASDRFGVDGFRYYLLHEVPTSEDGDFSWRRLAEAYNSDLANDLGNLVQRTAKMVTQYQRGVVGNLGLASHDTKSFREAIANFRLDRALDEIWLLIKGLNQYIDEEKPWEIAKTDPEHLQAVLSYMVAGILEVAQLLAPFLPTTASKIEKTFADGVVHPEVGVLFPRLDSAKG